MNINLISTLLITLFLPPHTHTQTWDHLAWLNQFALNQHDIVTCYNLLYDDDIDTFAATCDIGKLNDIENRTRRDFYAHKLTHPLLNDKEFLSLYFVEDDVDIIAEQLEMSPRIQSGLMTMAIVEGLIHHDK